MSKFPTLTGYYRFLFLYLEPCSTIYPAFHVFVYPGAQGFYDDMIPGGATSVVIEPRTRMAIWQLANCYFLLSLMSSFVFRAVRDSVPNTVSQEIVVGAVLKVLAIADVTHVAISFAGLPKEVRWDFRSWNAMTHGNISFVVLLLFSRLSWFYGVGRERFYYGRGVQKDGRDY
ncbi:hypothetical protein BJ322DRAFT_1056906 [Thelephora terrestris]|uniref:DUF7704 domain-containing protein n=1 Tax=Thelephora terrestris TaxID=56493 RepID=A0A9P6HFF8_9AGAM|nr:hypothetical protein BJ322DRAFT_1056906 [Thelephora terrestris]